MTDSITINSGIKRVMINDDPNRYIEFNPGDLLFAKKFYELIRSFQDKEKEYLDRAAVLDADNAVDKDGVPVTAEARMQLVMELCDFIRERIDGIFGPGTSEKVFGSVQDLQAFEQFFEGITPFIRAARTTKVSKYANKHNTKVME